MPNEFTFDGDATVAGAETRPSDPPASAQGLVVRPVFSEAMPVYVIPAPSSNSILTIVAANIASVLLLAANATRLGFSIANTSLVNTLYITTQVASSTTDFTVAVLPGGYYEDPYRYVGAVYGVWGPAATGQANIEEYRP